MPSGPRDRPRNLAAMAISGWTLHLESAYHLLCGRLGTQYEDDAGVSTGGGRQKVWGLRFENREGTTTQCHPHTMQWAPQTTEVLRRPTQLGQLASPRNARFPASASARRTTKPALLRVGCACRRIPNRAKRNRYRYPRQCPRCTMKWPNAHPQLPALYPVFAARAPAIAATLPRNCRGVPCSTRNTHLQRPVYSRLLPRRPRL